MRLFAALICVRKLIVFTGFSIIFNNGETRLDKTGLGMQLNELCYF